MLLKTVRVTNSRGSVMDLPLEDISGGFIVKSIDGLGPVKATLISAAFAGVDGEQFYGGRREKRNILVKLGLEPDYSVSSVAELRSQLYDFFMPMTEAKLQFKMIDRFSKDHLTEEHDREIRGWIETCEPDIFAKEPTIDVSIVCYKPDLIDPVERVYQNYISADQEESVHVYKGSVDTGFELEINFNTTVNAVTTPIEIRRYLFQAVPWTFQKLTINRGTYTSGQKLTIGSSHGNKHVTLRQTNGFEVSHLHNLKPGSDWLRLFPGENRFQAERMNAGFTEIPYEVKYTNKHGGL